MKPRQPNPASVAKRFASAGGVFVERPAAIAKKLERVRALVFDWDGVFNGGAGATGGFNEADSMGVNMLRFGLWRRDGRLPLAALVSGRDNPAAVEFGAREHFQSVYLGVGDKRVALRHALETHRVDGIETALIFDDINDLGMARESGLRFLVSRPGGPLFRRHVIAYKLCDYVTANDGSRCAVREVADLMLGLMGDFDAVLAARTLYDQSYHQYFALRQACATATFVQQDGRLVTR